MLTTTTTLAQVRAAQEWGLSNALSLAAAVERAAPSHNCMLLQNHGLICAGTTLNEAVDRTEELEQTARLYFILRSEQSQHPTPHEIAELHQAFK